MARTAHLPPTTGMAVVDVSTPSSPTLAGSLVGDSTNMNGARGIAVSGNYAYAASIRSDGVPRPP